MAVYSTGFRVVQSVSVCWIENGQYSGEDEEGAHSAWRRWVRTVVCSYAVW